MFTGLVQDVATVQRLEKGPGPSVSLWLSTRLPMEALELGASVCCNGVCLTVVERRDEGAYRVFRADVGPQTLKLSAFGARAPGDAINVEPALRVGDALGGHLVSGHVDGTARVASLGPQGGGFCGLTLHLPKALAQWVLPQGSLTVGGVSLTVVSKNDAGSGLIAVLFMLVPHTLSQTNLGSLKPGQEVEVECDSQVKAVCMTLEQVLPGLVVQGGS